MHVLRQTIFSLLRASNKGKCKACLLNKLTQQLADIGLMLNIFIIKSILAFSSKHKVVFVYSAGRLKQALHHRLNGHHGILSVSFNYFVRRDLQVKSSFLSHGPIWVGSVIKAQAFNPKWEQSHLGLSGLFPTKKRERFRGLGPIRAKV